jgi:hypothetical protein
LTPVLTELALDKTKSIPNRIVSVQIVLKLLKPDVFSLLIYILAFLTQVSIVPDNQLSHESLADFFASRITSTKLNSKKKNDELFIWLLMNWSQIVDGLLDAEESDGIDHIEETSAVATRTSGLTADELMVTLLDYSWPLSLPTIAPTARIMTSNPVVNSSYIAAAKSAPPPFSIVSSRPQPHNSRKSSLNDIPQQGESLLASPLSDLDFGNFDAEGRNRVEDCEAEGELFAMLRLTCH